MWLDANASLDGKRKASLPPGQFDASLPGLHASFCERLRGFGAGQISHPGFRRVGLLGVSRDAAGEPRHLLDAGRQWADEIDSWILTQFAHLLKSDLHLSARNDAPYEHAGRGLFQLGF